MVCALFMAGAHQGEVRWTPLADARGHLAAWEPARLRNSRAAPASARCPFMPVGAWTWTVAVRTRRCGILRSGGHLFLGYRPCRRRALAREF
jgi:hypothetical protein